MKIKISKSQWEQVGKTAGWIKQASGFGRFSKDLSDILEAQIMIGIQNGKDSNQIFNDIKKDTTLSLAIRDEEVTDIELKQLIDEHIRFLAILKNKKGK